MPDVLHELSPQVGHRREHAARNDVALYLGKPEFDLVEPGEIGRSEVQMNPSDVDPESRRLAPSYGPERLSAIT